jgi:DNA polymerase-3 subunit delta
VAEEQEMKPAYLIGGSDGAKIDAARLRLRARAESDGGAAALETFEPAGGGGPDAAALAAAVPAMALTVGRRYLLADGVDRWKAREVGIAAEALAAIPDETTVVLIAHGKAPAKLAHAVKDAGGEVLSYGAPRDRDVPARLVADARQCGFELEPAAARLVAERLGNRPLRLANELDRLALFAGSEKRVTVDDLEAMIADTSEAASWTLSDVLLEGDAAQALGVAERLAAQEEALTPLIYSLASRLRKANRAAALLAAGKAPKAVEGALEMHPFAARKLVAGVRQADPESLRAATCALADLEVWSRGGSDYEEEVALTLALRRALGLDD